MKPWKSPSFWLIFVTLLGVSAAVWSVLGSFSSDPSSKPNGSETAGRFAQGASGSRGGRARLEERGASGTGDTSDWAGSLRPPGRNGFPLSATESQAAEGSGSATASAGIGDGTGRIAFLSDASSGTSEGTGRAVGEGGDPNAEENPKATDSDSAEREGLEAQKTPTDSEQKTPQPEDTGGIIGFIRGRLTGIPLREVRIELRLAGSVFDEQVSGLSGNFQFRDLEPGDYQVAASGRRVSQNVKVFPGAESEVLLEVDDRTSLSGRVLNPYTDPLPDARVRLFSVGGHHSTGETEMDSTLTGPGGSFILASAPAGVPIKLTASHAWYASAIRGPFVIDREEPQRDIVLQVSNGGRIGGTVSDEEGKSVSGAKLEARVLGIWGNVPPSSQGSEAVSNAQGFYEIEGLPLGEWEVQTSAEGYALRRDSVIVNSIEQPARLDIRLRKGSTVSGIVLDPDGNPVPRARVALFGRLLRTDETADYAGAFRFESISQGSYEVAAHSPGNSVGYVTDLSESSQDVTIRLRRIGRLYIKVVDQGNRPVRDYTLRLRAEGWSARMFPGQTERDVRVTNEEGIHDSMEMSGPFQVRVLAQGYRPGAPEAPIRVEAGSSPTEPVVIRLEGGIRLDGLVTDGSNGIPNVQVCWYFGHIPRTGTFQIPNPAHLANPGGTTITGINGWFEFDNLPPEPVTIIARAEGWASWMDNTLDMQNPPGNYEIVLQPSGRVIGTVTHAGVPFPDATVTLQPSENPEVVPPEWNSTTDATGRFRIDNVLSGAYRLLVTRHYFGSILTRGFMMTVPQGEIQTHIEIPTGRLRVVVVNAATQEPMRTGPIYLTPTQTLHDWGDTTLVLPPKLTLNNANSDEEFVFVCLPPGTYYLEAAPRGFTAVSLPITLGMGEVLSQNVVVEPAGGTVQ